MIVEMPQDAPTKSCDEDRHHQCAHRRGGPHEGGIWLKVTRPLFLSGLELPQRPATHRNVVLTLASHGPANPSPGGGWRGQFFVFRPRPRRRRRATRDRRTAHLPAGFRVGATHLQAVSRGRSLIGGGPDRATHARGRRRRRRTFAALLSSLPLAGRKSADTDHGLFGDCAPPSAD